MGDNREQIIVTVCGDKGSWVRNVQENPHIALTALALLEAYYHGQDLARTRAETEKYLIENKRLERPDSLAETIGRLNERLTSPETP